jgi:hypothetical protein
MYMNLNVHIAYAMDHDYFFQLSIVRNLCVHFEARFCRGLLGFSKKGGPVFGGCGRPAQDGPRDENGAAWNEMGSTFSYKVVPSILSSVGGKNGKK